MKCFLLVLANSDLRQDVLNFLDTRPEVLNWAAPMGTSVLVVSEHDSFYLASLFRAKFSGMIFIISEVRPETTDGWAPQGFWDMLGAPKPSGKWPKPISASSVLLGEASKAGALPPPPPPRKPFK